MDIKLLTPYADHVVYNPKDNTLFTVFILEDPLDKYTYVLQTQYEIVGSSLRVYGQTVPRRSEVAIFNKLEYIGILE